MKQINTNEVFGVSNDKIATYIEREKVDQAFVDGLTKNKHIVVFGASKQGKTALTNKHLPSENYIKVNCSPTMQTIDIYRSLLRQIGISFEETHTKTKSIEGEISSEIKAKVRLPFVGELEAAFAPKGGGSHESSSTYRELEYNLDLAQDISELLRKAEFKKRIILENFHYLEDKVQHKLAMDLRIFEDYNILFIILGIWREKNRLTQFNGDLIDRLIEVPVEPWEKADLLKIIEKGQQLLNVSFDVIKNSLLESCFDSVGVFQELCKETCYFAGVMKKVSSERLLTKEHLKQANQKKLEDYSSRHIKSLEAFAEQKVKKLDEIPLYIPYYFVKILLTQSFMDIYKGVRRRDLQDKIKEIHHRGDDVRPSDMGNFLSTIVSSQMRKNISPPIFDYDISTATVKIINSTFYFFLKNCDRQEVLNSISSPSRLKEDDNKIDAVQGDLFLS